MIVVDTNLIVYFFLHGEFSDLVDKIFLKDSNWIAPILWRSEFRNVLAKGLKDRFYNLDNAIQIMGEAERLMMEREYLVDSMDILNVADLAGCSAYDAEFVALAQGLSLHLLTWDKKLLKEFPETAIRPDRFI